jgi:hypothetical protein
MQIIRGKILGALKVVVYGPEGIGKSTFASKFPDPLFIDTEGSTKEMDVARFPAPTSWSMLLEQVKYVRDNPGICKTLVIDTADWAEQLCIDYIIAKANKDSIKGIEDFGYGKGYVYLAENFGKLLNSLNEVIETNTYVVLTAHAKMRKVDLPDETGGFDRWEMKLGKNTAPLVKEWADMVLFANYKIYVVNVDNQGAEKGKNKAQGGKRVMYTSHHPCWDAKNRHDLKEELDFNYSEIEHIITREQTTARSKVLDQIPVPEDETSKPEPEPINIPTEKPEPQKSTEQPKTEPKTEPTVSSARNSKLPKALTDLMAANDVTEEEIKRVVAKRGYYPIDTPIENYDPKFVSGVLVGAWPQVFKMIDDMRCDDLPFSIGGK